MRSRFAVIPLLAALLTASPAEAATACEPPGHQTYGTASTTGAIVGATVHEGRAYVVSRGPKPPVVAEIDLATRKVTRTATLPDGPAAGEPEGGWATAVSGGKLYIGTYPVPDLYSFDLASGQVTHIRSFGAQGGFVWSLAAAPDGTLYLGTSSDGRVWEYEPSTGAVRRYGVLVSGEHYVRAVAADDTTVYAGLLEKTRLMAVDRVSGAVRELAQGPGAVGTIALHGERVLASSGSSLLDVRKDGTDLRTIPSGAGAIDAFAPAPDGGVYLTARPDGALFRYRTGDTALTKVAAPPAVGEETRLLHLDGGTLTGLSGSGILWTLDLATGATRADDLLDIGFPAGAERVQSMLLVPNRALYIGGHFAVEVLDLRTGERRRIRVVGEPKAMTRRGNKVYAAMYPTGQVISIDVRTDEVRTLGTIGHGQSRPWDIEHDPVTDTLLVASAPTGANLKGALTIVDPDTGHMEVHHDVIRDQSLMTLAVDSPNGIVYLGGDVLGGGGTPVRTTAALAAFDLRTRSVLWEAEPLPGHRTFQDLKVHDGLVYAVYKRVLGAWAAFDPRTRTVVRQGLLSGHGELQHHRGRLFTSTFFGGGNAYELGEEARLLATGLGDEWHTAPQLQFEPGSWNAWTIIGRDLAKVRLDPGCPALTIPAAQS
ncbi:PQQ-binding-like beta-propeller repeat protein [Nonomuraea soli]|uniref:Outer membrane protein assembly factor BamB n=1 Tax=Nonomuraea soli TaxID=1032476 RepID=A0A7W0CP47_9ACTN|nr:PQQ-binding-like beta-propeller repeat protein [Nonomuraea soli]MBA2894648.1 outer membrane protein assembly factor BamB [Nonomuraea soli]